MLSLPDVEHSPVGRFRFKCYLPIRDSVWNALPDGATDCAVSNCSPSQCIAELKTVDASDVMGAWGGICTLKLGLSLL